jgi:hypothetical protein
MTDKQNIIGSAVGASVKRDPYRLDFVLMPLVKMLAEEGISWSQREQVAHAMLATMRHHKSMIDEMSAQMESAQSGISQSLHK